MRFLLVPQHSDTIIRNAMPVTVDTACDNVDSRFELALRRAYDDGRTVKVNSISYYVDEDVL